MKITTIEDRKRKSFVIIFLLAIMTICMSASIVSCIFYIDRISDKNSESNSMLVSHVICDGIKNKFEDPIIVAKTMASDYFLKEYMEQSGEKSPEKVEQDVATYLESIRTGFGYPMIYAVCDATRIYYTCDGFCKHVDVENDETDLWYKEFLERQNTYDLNVDTDAANNWELSVFVNHRIVDDKGTFLGVCGVGIEVEGLQELLLKYEQEYQVKINLIDRTGLIQIDTENDRIEKVYLDNSYLEQVGSRDFYYEAGEKTSRMTKYMKELDWYLVVEDLNPDKIDVAQMVTASIIIFVLGLALMLFVFFVMSVREQKACKELVERKRMLITDDITGLLNRHAYEEDSKELMESNSFSNKTIIMMDINGLKSVNDNDGHLAGDELIIGAAKCIQTTMGTYGKVYRIGGDEFAAIIECSKKQLEDILGTFDHLTNSWRGENQNELTISKGIVVCSEYEELSFNEMKQLADGLMYQDKEAYYERTGKVRRKI